MANTTITPTVGAVTQAGVAPTLQLATGIVPPSSPVPGGYLATWNSLALNAVGQPVQLGAWNRAYFSAQGTFGAGGSVQMEGSNDGTNWTKLSPAALTGAGLFAALGQNEMPLYVRPHVTAGDGTTSLTVQGWFKQ